MRCWALGVSLSDDVATFARNADVEWSGPEASDAIVMDQNNQENAIPKGRPTRNARPNHIHLVGRCKNEPILTDKHESSNELRVEKSQPFPWDITMSYGDLLQLFSCFCLNLSIFVREAQPDQTSTNLLANFLLTFRAGLLVGPQWDRFVVLF